MRPDLFAKLLPAGSLLLVLALSLWLYWPGHEGPALLDDRPVLLRITDLQQTPSFAQDYILHERSGPLGRPVSMVTFVLERLYLGESIAVSKLSNIYLHLFNGLLVCWLLCLLLPVVGLRKPFWLALVLSSIWLLSPLYVSTVLYAVQRMAMLAATFSVLSCIAYCYWRRALYKGRFKPSLLVLAVCFALLGVFSKENAIVVVPLVLLIEALWYQFRQEGGGQIEWLRRIVLVLIVAGASGLLLALFFQYEYLQGTFSRRRYSLEERVMTQLPILWDYLGQLVWPDTTRMGIYHDDYPISTAWNQPISTLHAFLAWVLVLAGCCLAWFWRWGRYLSLGVLWFLVAHSMEASVFSLELYFEHRNYLPGVGLLLILGVIFAWVVKRWPEVGRPLLVYLACYALWLALQTSALVQIWSSRPLLAFNHVNGHPESYRALTDMSVLMATLGDFELAKEYSTRAHKVGSHERSADQGIREISLACMAHQSVSDAQIERLGTVDSGRPIRSGSGLILLVRMMQDDACPTINREKFADRMAEIFLSPKGSATAQRGVYYGLAVLENALQRYENAFEYTELFLRKSPWDKNGLFMKLHFTTALGNWEQREIVVSRLQQLKEQGKLTVREQQTLSLYLENQP